MAKKKLKIYERFLLAMAFAVDELIDFHRAGRATYRARGLFNFWSPPGYDESNIRHILNRMLRTGYIEKVIKNGSPYLRLTSKANAKLQRDFPIYSMQRKKWDGKWRVVIFDIKEKEKHLRNALRDKLKELGFGMLQKSIYISPYDFVKDMYEFLQAKKILGKAFILTARHELMGEPQDLANYVWQLDKLSDEYEELRQKILEVGKSKNKTRAIKQIKNSYLEIISDDPFLPKELLPADWPGEEVKKAVIDL